MADETPIAMITKWIANLERHEKDILKEKEEAENEFQKKIKRIDDMLLGTRGWMLKFQAMQNILEETNRESVDILNRDADANLKNELGTHFERIGAFLLSRGNKPQTIVEIEQGTSIPRTSISAVVYRTHNEKFVESYARDKRGKLWALKMPDESADVSFDPPPTPPDSGSIPSEPLGDKDVPF
jgi:hypothetical protein